MLPYLSFLSVLFFAFELDLIVRACLELRSEINLFRKKKKSFSSYSQKYVLALFRVEKSRNAFEYQTG